MRFGFSSLIDLLSWLVVALLGLKVVATIILLRRDRRRWFESRASAALWWSTKITPLLAVPCMIAIARIEHDLPDAWGYAMLMAFVLVAVPLVVWRQFRRPAPSGLGEHGGAGV